MISEHFDVEDVNHTDHDIPNEAPSEALDYATRLANEVLEPWMVLVGPMKIDSWYRCPELNKVVGGEKQSAHLEGRAADCVPRGNIEAAFKMLLASDIPFDKAILEHRHSTWIHVQINQDPAIARRQAIRGVQEGDHMAYLPYNG